MYGCEKAYGEPDWRRRIGYTLLGELHIPGRLRVWHMIKALRRLNYWRAQPISVLDAGGGEGAFAYHCARRFPQWRVTVVDDEVESLERGQQIKTRLALQNLEIRQVDLLDFHEANHYDVVVCSDVLEHIECDEIAVYNLTRALKPGGVIILTSPSIPQRKHLAWVAQRERRIGFHPSQYGHVRDGYSADEMRRFFQQTGLKVEAIQWTFGRFGTLMFDLFFVTGDSQPHTLVYVLLFPVHMGLSCLDLLTPNRSGSAIMAIGRKP